MDVAYINPFITAVTRVLKEMAQASCIVGQPFRKRPGHRFHRLYTYAAEVQLSGAARGLIALDFTPPVAMAVGAAVAGQPFTTVDADCADALAEVVNVVAGVAKKEMPGGQVSLSIARLLRTHQVVYPATLPVIAIPFETDKGRLVMEVSIGPGAASN